MGELQLSSEHRTIPRRRLCRIGALAALALVTATTAGAQVTLTPDAADPDETLVEELVVTARDRGPAFWRVSDADTTVYVLGVPSVAPKGAAWDRAALERRLEGANEVILPFNEIKVKVLGVPGAALNLLRLKSGTPYEEKLPPELKARFVAARTAMGKAAKDYKTSNGVAAGLLLVSNYRDHARLTAADPAKTIGRLAKAKDIKVEQKAYSFGPLSGAVLRTKTAAQQACVADALDEVEKGAASAKAAWDGWAVGDVRTALSAERGFEKCIAAVDGGLAFDAKLKADQAKSIARALEKPGHAVAVVPLRPLLAQGGVLDRLRADGYTVKTPGE